MTNVPILDSEFFGAINSIAQLIPKFSDRRKIEIREKTEEILELETLFHKKAVEFTSSSFSDELLGVSYELKTKKEYLKSLYIIYAAELVK